MIGLRKQPFFNSLLPFLCGFSTTFLLKLSSDIYHNSNLLAYNFPTSTPKFTLKFQGPFIYISLRLTFNSFTPKLLCPQNLYSPPNPHVLTFWNQNNIIHKPHQRSWIILLLILSLLLCLAHYKNMKPFSYIRFYNKPPSHYKTSYTR